MATNWLTNAQKCVKNGFMIWLLGTTEFSMLESKSIFHWRRMIIIMLMRCLLIISLSVKLIAVINKWHETQAQ